MINLNIMAEKQPINLVWIDLEMTGLDPQFEKIIEIAIIITNYNLDIIATAPVLVIHQDDVILEKMDNWNKKVHAKTGLIDKVKVSVINEEQAQKIMLEFLKNFVPKGKSPMCGNSVHQDRRFLQKYMPELESYFHYRNIDVSTLKELCKLWNKKFYKKIIKQSAHQALDDIKESIEELKYYKENFLKTE